jgi:hypothetical protein
METAEHVAAITNLGCKECGSFEDNHNCIHCHKPVCPKHRAGFGEVGYYFCSMGCTVEHAFPTPRKHITGSQVAVWLSNSAVVCSALFLLYEIIRFVIILHHQE